MAQKARPGSFGVSRAASFPIPHTDSPGVTIDLNERMFVHRHASFLFRMEGAAMTGAGIFDGDVVIVDRAIEPKNGQIVLAAVNGTHLIRRYHSVSGGLCLTAENPAFAPMRFSGEDDVSVWGVVTGALKHLL